MNLDFRNNFDEGISTIPEISQPYYTLLLSNSKDRDIVYAPRYDNQVLKTGNKPLVLNNENIQVDHRQYQNTLGLHELLFKNNPTATTPQYFDNYKDILQYNNAHIGYTDRITLSRGFKYTNIIKPLFNKSGNGVIDNKMQYNKFTSYVRWDEPNALYNILRLLVAAKQACNNVHSNKIQYIIEELKECGLIINKKCTYDY